MDNYSVHVYTQVRVKVAGIRADDHLKAISAAEGALDLHELLDNLSPRGGITAGVPDTVRVECVAWTEGAPDFFLVDPLMEDGEVDDIKSQWLGPDLQLLVDGKTTDERKAQRADLAATFMAELLDSVESLTAVAEEHGPRTLADLMYLHSAIVKGGFIDHWPNESMVMTLVRDLPSSEAWVKHIKDVTQDVNRLDAQGESSVDEARVESL